MTIVRKILVATDFGEASARALDFGRMLADACGAALHLLHVVPSSVENRDRENRDRRQACAQLEALLNERDRATRHATTTCRVGTIAAEILSCAVENGVDLIVMGTHSHGPTFQMIRGSVAEQVLEAAPCAVLAVKAASVVPHNRADAASTAAGSNRS